MLSISRLYCLTVGIILTHTMGINYSGFVAGKDVTQRHRQKDYEIFEKSMPWKDAQAYCKNIHGLLATFLNEEEANAVINSLFDPSKTQVSKNGNKKVKVGHHIYWVGLTDQDNWSWDAKGKLVSSDIQPDSSTSNEMEEQESADKPCVALLYPAYNLKKQKQTFVSKDCKYKYFFICQVYKQKGSGTDSDVTPAPTKAAISDPSLLRRGVDKFSGHGPAPAFQERKRSHKKFNPFDEEYYDPFISDERLYRLRTTTSTPKPSDFLLMDLKEIRSHGGFSLLFYSSQSKSESSSNERDPADEDKSEELPRKQSSSEELPRKSGSKKPKRKQSSSEELPRKSTPKRPTRNRFDSEEEAPPSKEESEEDTRKIASEEETRNRAPEEPIRRQSESEERTSKQLVTEEPARIEMAAEETTTKEIPPEEPPTKVIPPEESLQNRSATESSKKARKAGRKVKMLGRGITIPKKSQDTDEEKESTSDEAAEQPALGNSGKERILGVETTDMDRGIVLNKTSQDMESTLPEAVTEKSAADKISSDTAATQKSHSGETASDDSAKVEKRQTNGMESGITLHKKPPDTEEGIVSIPAERAPTSEHDFLQYRNGETRQKSLSE